MLLELELVAAAITQHSTMSGLALLMSEGIASNRVILQQRGGCAWPAARYVLSVARVEKYEIWGRVLFAPNGPKVMGLMKL